MKVNFEFTNKSGLVNMCQLENILVEEMDDSVSIHADDYMMTIPGHIINQDHTDSTDSYMLSDGSRLEIENIG